MWDGEGGERRIWKGGGGWLHDRGEATEELVSTRRGRGKTEGPKEGATAEVEDKQGRWR